MCGTMEMCGRCPKCQARLAERRRFLPRMRPIDVLKPSGYIRVAKPVKKKKTRITKSAGSTGITKSTEKTGITKSAGSTGITKSTEKTGITKSAGSTGITKSTEKTGITKSAEDTGIFKSAARSTDEAGVKGYWFTPLAFPNLILDTTKVKATRKAR
jgi:hypothetical protein